jgi:hypothetical protein
MDIRRRAGVSPSDRFTRTSLKPKILFPTEDRLRANEAAAEEADEEAVTDIEVPYPSSKRAVPNDIFANSTGQSSKLLNTPLEQYISIAESSNSTSASHNVITPGPEVPIVSNKRLLHPKRGRNLSPFDSWGRTKVTKPVESSKSTKRQASPMEKSAKRVRSGSYTAPT